MTTKSDTTPLDAASMERVDEVSATILKMADAAMGLHHAALAFDRAFTEFGYRVEREFAELRRRVEAMPEPQPWGAQLFRGQAAAYLGISPHTLDGLARQGIVRSYVPGGLRQRAYRRADLDAYIETSRAETGRD